MACIAAPLIQRPFPAKCEARNPRAFAAANTTGDMMPAVLARKSAVQP